MSTLKLPPLGSTTTLTNPATTPLKLSSSGFDVSKTRCRIHPTVVMSMLYAHNRIAEADRFAVGTLLGTVIADGVRGVIVDISDCFANPYHWDVATNTLTVQKEPHDWMLKLREKVNAKLSVVGWYCTSGAIVYTTALSDWVQSEPVTSRFISTKTLPEPVHVLVDPSLTHSDTILDTVKAYIRGPLRQIFHEIQIEMSIHPNDMPGASAILRASSYYGDPPVSNKLIPKNFNSSQSRMAYSLGRLQELIAHAMAYVQAVLSDKIVPDAAIGRQLMRCLARSIVEPKEAASGMTKTAVEDNFMVALLMNLSRLSMAIAEKLNRHLL